MRKETTQLLKDLFREGFELVTVDDEAEIDSDEDIYAYMHNKNLIMLSKPSMARFWYFTSLEALVRYFNNGGKVGIDNHAQILK